MSPSSEPSESTWLLDVVHRVARASEAGDDETARQVLEVDGKALDRSTVRRLFDEVARLARNDQSRAAMVADLANRLADLLDDDSSRALAQKASGFLLYLRSDYESALEHFQRAAKLFLENHDSLEYAATLNTSIHTLSYLGRYDEAYAAAAEARAIFESAGEELRLARLDSNEGNVLFRQERIDEAQDRYRSALRRLRDLNAPPQDVAAALHNIVTCAIALHDFEGALGAYDEIREHCERHDLAPVAAQAEYNIAYLYFLRGEYERSLELYRAARILAKQAGDRYHLALCDLDQAEILLELNMRDEGGRMAASARSAFEELGLGYEAAKATTFVAIAASQQGQAVLALELFEQAGEQFEAEGNKAWVSIIDLYRAVIYYDEKRYLEARKIARSALSFFVGTSLESKSVLCELILARTALEIGDAAEASQRAISALNRVEAMERPALAFRVRWVAAQVAEARGDRKAALKALAESADLLEDLRSHLRGEDLKLAFLRDKSEVYESIVALTMADRRPSASAKRSVFAQIERAKSRTLADLVSFRAPMLPSASGHSRLVDQMRRLRTELNWYYRHIDAEEIRSARTEASESRGSAESESLSDATDSAESQLLRNLYEKSRSYEQDLIATLTELRTSDAEFGSLQGASVLDLSAIRAALPEGAMFLELFEARDLVYGCCVGKSTLEVIALTTGTLVRDLQHKLTFQLSKFRLGDEYFDQFADTLLSSTRGHLAALYRELIAPLRPHLDADHLIIVPHGGMHYLPFHAFLDGDRYLIDDYSISYAPSANVYALCAGKQPSAQSGSLVLGVASPELPSIGLEAEAVAAALPDSLLLQNEAATEERLRNDGPKARRIHIATHGFFRQDNPMFSAIQLGDSRLTLYDLYSLRLDADLVVLSGCGTGLNVVQGGDELIGLTRGLLYAGARSVVASLWDVNDESAVRLMSDFYRSYSSRKRSAEALREAMRRLRETHPHPYYWAPFLLLGQF